ncbi:MAG TPA: rod shape-determining protein MreD [Roseiflexaceae bacterium]|nr:rod shape-determining protein MreD [Roseiflexaceae bacterium]
MGSTQPRRIEERIARELGLALALLAIALAQAALMPRLLGSTPNLMLLLTICQALIVGPANAARWAFYGGLALDLGADTALGVHALALLAAVLVTAPILARFSRGNWLLPLLGAMLGSLAYHTMLGLLTLLLVAPISPRVYLQVVALPSTILVLVPALPLFLSMRWLEGRRRGEVPVDVY